MHQSGNRPRPGVTNWQVYDAGLSKFWRKYSSRTEMKFARNFIRRAERREAKKDIEREIEDDFPADDYWDKTYRDVELIDTETDGTYTTETPCGCPTGTERCPHSHGEGHPA